MHCTVDWLILVLNTISSELFLNSVGCKTTHTLFIKSRAWSSWCCGQASFHLFHSIHSLIHSFIVLFKYLFIYLFSGWDWCQLPAAPVFADVWSHPPIDFFGKRPFVYVFRNCIIPSDHLPISHTSNGCMSKHFMNTQKHFISSIPLCSFFSSSHEQSQTAYLFRIKFTKLIGQFALIETCSSTGLSTKLPRINF